jgi:hypothetical protein
MSRPNKKKNVYEALLAIVEQLRDLYAPGQLALLLEDLRRSDDPHITSADVQQIFNEPEKFMSPKLVRMLAVAGFSITISHPNLRSSSLKADAARAIKKETMASAKGMLQRAQHNIAILRRLAEGKTSVTSISIRCEDPEGFRDEVWIRGDELTPVILEAAIAREETIIKSCERVIAGK